MCGFAVPHRLELTNSTDAFPVTVRVADLFADTAMELGTPTAPSERIRSFNVTVNKDQTAPVIRSIEFEKSPITKDGEVVVLVDASDNVGVTSLVLTATIGTGQNQINKTGEAWGQAMFFVFSW